ncbi:ATP-binding protein [Hymenobacter negativus]|uniref:ATP-binding protein n=1 Tax=Hymenobacter negativus TaxID=2795026 RepID=UPI001E3B82CA|nr:MULTISPECIES: ATP-binding protein [Bacteria]
MSKQAFIDNLYTKRATYTDPDQAEMAANMLETLSSDIYTESQRFVFELIQNADDAAHETGNEVRFDFFENYLLVSHNGSPFTVADIESITGAGSSSKKNDPTKTGYKGIGFKSVFGKSDWVGIFSDGYHFRFEKDFHTTLLPWQVIPIWTEASALASEVRRFVETSDYHVTTAIQLPDAAALEHELEELLHNGQILLFLRQVNTIKVARQGQVLYTIFKTVESATSAYQPTTLWKDRKATSNWLVQRFDQLPVDAETQKELRADKKTPAKLRNCSHTELAFAARVDSGRIRALTAEESLLFTYLPTKVADFGFPFLVNGSFLTSAAREGLHEDRVWNQWLLGLVADNLFAWLAQLASQDGPPLRGAALAADAISTFRQRVKESLYRKSQAGNCNVRLRSNPKPNTDPHK